MHYGKGALHMTSRYLRMLRLPRPRGVYGLLQL